MSGNKDDQEALFTLGILTLGQAELRAVQLGQRSPPSPRQGSSSGNEGGNEGGDGGEGGNEGGNEGGDGGEGGVGGGDNNVGGGNEGGDGGDGGVGGGVGGENFDSIHIDTSSPLPYDSGDKYKDFILNTIGSFSANKISAKDSQELLEDLSELSAKDIIELMLDDNDMESESTTDDDSQSPEKKRKSRLRRLFSFVYGKIRGTSTKKPEKADSGDSTQRINKLEELLKTSQAENEALKQSLKTSQADNEEILRRWQKERAENTSGEAKNDVAVLKKQISDFEKAEIDKTYYKKLYKKSEIQVSDLEAEKIYLESQIKALTTKLGEAQVANQTAAQQASVGATIFENKLTLLQGENENLEKEVSGLTAEVKRLKAEVERLGEESKDWYEATVKKQEEAIASEEALTKAKKEKIAALAEAANEKEASEKALAKAKKEKIASEKALAKATEEKEASEKALAKAKKEKIASEKALAGVMSEMETLTKLNSYLNTRLEESNAQVEKLQAQVDELQAQVDELQAQLQTVMAEKAEMALSAGEIQKLLEEEKAKNLQLLKEEKAKNLQLLKEEKAKNLKQERSLRTTQTSLSEAEARIAELEGEIKRISNLADGKRTSSTGIPPEKVKSSRLTRKPVIVSEAGGESDMKQTSALQSGRLFVGGWPSPAKQQPKSDPQQGGNSPPKQQAKSDPEQGGEPDDVALLTEKYNSTEIARLMAPVDDSGTRTEKYNSTEIARLMAPLDNREKRTFKFEKEGLNFEDLKKLALSLGVSYTQKNSNKELTKKGLKTKLRKKANAMNPLPVSIPVTRSKSRKKLKPLRPVTGSKIRKNLKQLRF